MDNSVTIQICELASYLRSSQYHKKSSAFSCSISLWQSLLSSFDLLEEADRGSFHVKQTTNSKELIIRDVKFLQTFISEIKTVKLYQDNKLSQNQLVDLSKCRNLATLECLKISITSIRGLQKLRSQLQKLQCNKSFNSIHDVLSSCGGDESDGYYWNELKEFNFSSNELLEIDNSIEFAPWLHTLDLSHNRITNIEPLNCLNNLKYLNLSYNKLETISNFKGLICSRLQNFILKNNFIEDISGLQSLTNVWVLDLSSNCLIEHKMFLSLSHLATLQWLNLENNPAAFHPDHRPRIATCLHQNTASTNFVLDRIALSREEKKHIGTLHPMQIQNNSAAMTESVSFCSDKIRKIRHVTIEEEIGPKLRSVPSSCSLPKAYLETKKQIEQLHEQYGESWLNSHSGLLVQNVLGLEGSPVPVSSSPYEADFSIHSADFYNDSSFIKNSTKVITSEKPKTEDVTHKADQESVVDATINQLEEETFVTAYDTTANNSDRVHVSESSDDDDLDEIECEDDMFLVIPKNETEQIFLIITKNHIAEKECTTSKERTRWHLKSIIKCDNIKDTNEIQMQFDTMRKDRQQRIYIFEEDEVGKFIARISDIMSSNAKTADDSRNCICYQCMKCSTTFNLPKTKSVLIDNSAVKCPSCDSTLIVEM